MGETRRKFSREFKIEAVRLVAEGGQTIAETARELGINANMLGRWQQQLTENGEQAFPGTERSGASGLMERVLARPNMLAALKRVRKNKGSLGIDGMTVDELPDWLREHWPRIREELLAGTYRPQPVKRQLIPKTGGGNRALGIPTVLGSPRQLHGLIGPTRRSTMDKVIKDGTDMTIGVDLGDKWSRLCVLDEHGEVCEEGRIATTAHAMRKRFSTEAPCRIVKRGRVPIRGFGDAF